MSAAQQCACRGTGYLPPSYGDYYNGPEPCPFHGPKDTRSTGLSGSEWIVTRCCLGAAGFVLTFEAATLQDVFWRTGLELTGLGMLVLTVMIGLDDTVGGGDNRP